jgi:hypothetical protein
MSSTSVGLNGAGKWLCRAAIGVVSSVVVLGSLGAGAGETTPASKWVSSGAVLYAETPHPAALLDRASDARVRAILDTTPALRGVLESDGVVRLRDGVRLVTDKLGKPWDESVRLLTGGGAVLAVEANEGSEPGTVLIVTPTDAAFLRKAVDTLIALAREDAANNGRPDPVKSAEYRGLTGYQVGPKATFAVVKDRLVIADRGDTIKAVVDRALDGLPSGGTVEDSTAWASRKVSVTSDTLAWGFAHLERLRKLDPDKFQLPDKNDGGATLMFAGWLETLRHAPWLSGSLAWTDKHLQAALAMPAMKEGRPESLKGFIPPKGAGAPGLVNVPEAILTASLWRDLAAAWEARAELFKPDDADRLGELGANVAQFFGGGDFGKTVLGSTTPDWRLVVAAQDVKTLALVPDVKLPAFALVFDLKPGAEDLATRLKVGFQSLIGRVNIEAAASGNPPLELRTETLEGVTLETSRFVPPTTKDAPKDPKEPVHYRHNYTPTFARVGSHVVVSTSHGLARDLVKAFQPATAGAVRAEDATLVAEADGDALARLVGTNRSSLVQQNMHDKGHDRARAESEVDLMAALLRYLGHGRMTVKDGADLWRLDVEFKPGG